uniref:C2H2-type domain-containing protein n=1 Tax=Schistocephalus solidus TaxID=70667 RepID=A0A183STI8_SCHSO
LHKDISPERRRPAEEKEITVTPTESKKDMDQADQKAKESEERKLVAELLASSETSIPMKGQESDDEPRKLSAHVASVKREHVSLSNADTLLGSSEASSETPSVLVVSSAAPSQVTTQKEDPKTLTIFEPSESNARPTNPVSTELSKPTDTSLVEPFRIRSGAQKGRILSFIMFNYSLDWILAKALHEYYGVRLMSSALLLWSQYRYPLRGIERASTQNLTRHSCPLAFIIFSPHASFLPGAALPSPVFRTGCRPSFQILRRCGALRISSQRPRKESLPQSSTCVCGHISHYFTIIETTSEYSSPVTSTTTTTISNADSLLNCPLCDHIFTSRIGLVGHLRIHRTEADEPVPGAPTYSRRARLHCPHCSPTNRIAAAKTKRAARKSPAPRTNTADAHALPTCPRRQRIFRARIGLVGHLRT